MKKGIVFLLGVLTGIVLTFIFAFIYSIYLSSDPNSDPRITYFKTPTEFTISDKFEVFQVLEAGALAHSRDYSYSSDIYGDPTVFIIAKGQNTFYDDQRINASYKKVLQLGTFKYSSQLGERVVPVIEIQVNQGQQLEHAQLNKENDKSDGEITYAVKPSPFTVSNKFKVSEVLEHGVVAKCKEKDVDLYFEPLIYIPADGQNMYYNDQIIRIPSGKKAVQVGTIKLNEHHTRNVLPIIEFQ